MAARLVSLRPLVGAAACAILAAVAMALLYFGSELLIPLAVAVVIWHLINALASAYHRVGLRGRLLPLWLCYVGALLTIFGALTVMVELIMANITQVSQAAPAYEANLHQLLTAMYDKVGLETAPSFTQIVAQVSIGSIVAAVAATLGGLAGSAGIVVVYVVFLLLEQSSFDRKLHALMPDPARATRLLRLLRRIALQIQGYLWVKTLMSLLTGTASYAILWAVGVDFAQFWALIIFLLNYIPTIGAMLGVIFPSLLALVQFETIIPFLIVSSSLTATQFMVGNLLEPRAMGRKLNLSPLVIILSLTLWGMLWGVVGMILCVPITVILMIICGHFAPTRPIAIMLSSDGQVDWHAEGEAAP